MPAPNKKKTASVADDALQADALVLIENPTLYSLHRVTLALERSRDAVIEREFRLSSVEWRILTTVAALEPLSTKALSDQTGIDKPTISRATAALAGRGLLDCTTDKRDKRLVSISLTTNGRLSCEDVVEYLKQWNERLLAVLPPKIRASLREASAILADRLAELTS